MVVHSFIPKGITDTEAIDDGQDLTMSQDVEKRVTHQENILQSIFSLFDTLY